MQGLNLSSETCTNNQRPEIHQQTQNFSMLNKLHSATNSKDSLTENRSSSVSRRYFLEPKGTSFKNYKRSYDQLYRSDKLGHLQK